MAALAAKPRYVYTQEIASMVFVCTAIKDPDDDLAQFLEDVVRSEMAELVRPLSPSPPLRCAFH